MENKQEFVRRADEHIQTANAQINEYVTPGEVSASFMYGVARFNAWLAAREYKSAEDFKAEKEKAMEYFISEYKKMLEEHIDNHIQNFDFN